MKCPNEEIEMRQIQVESHYGQTIVLDQCEKCGGIWFDKLELYSSKQGQAEKVELMDKEALNSLSIIENSELRCPEDKAKLVQFKDRYFPQDILILHCPLCDGFWLNRGEFKKYQNYRGKLQNRNEVVVGDADGLEGVAQASRYYPDRTDDALGRLSKFLSMPVDPYTRRPIDSTNTSSEDREKMQAVMNVLTIILRILLRR